MVHLKIVMLFLTVSNICSMWQFNSAMQRQIQSCSIFLCVRGTCDFDYFLFKILLFIYESIVDVRNVFQFRTSKRWVPHDITSSVFQPISSSLFFFLAFSCFMWNSSINLFIRWGDVWQLCLMWLVLPCWALAH